MTITVENEHEISYSILRNFETIFTPLYTKSGDLDCSLAPLICYPANKVAVMGIVGEGYFVSLPKQAVADSLTTQAVLTSLEYAPSNQYLFDRQTGYIIYDMENDIEYGEGSHLWDPNFDYYFDYVGFSGDGRKERFLLYPNIYGGIIVLNNVITMFDGATPNMASLERVITASIVIDPGNDSGKKGIKNLDTVRDIVRNYTLFASDMNFKDFSNRCKYGKLDSLINLANSKKVVTHPLLLSSIIGDPEFSTKQAKAKVYKVDLALPPGIANIYSLGGTLHVIVNSNFKSSVKELASMLLLDETRIIVKNKKGANKDVNS
jgi:hypothetical protein